MKPGFDLKKRRQELGLTLEQVGDYCGVGKSTVRKWETGMIQNMRRDKIALLAKILQVSPVELLGDAPAERPAGRKPGLTEEDRRLLQIFHQLTPEARTVLIGTAESMVRQPGMRQDGGTASAV